ncbi:MAG: DUF4080 domain-containing protein [Clostridiaceae bacterium]|jgi:radical SAM superfamily enzyme YgiQ (UPF0313 family)|nr:DUF4080 domain-containing protein [Clostridiaceae bacterium]
MTRLLLCAFNARFDHTCLAVRELAAGLRASRIDGLTTEVREWTVNDPLLALLHRLVAAAADIYAFSCYIWNRTLTETVCLELKKLRPDAVVIWGGPEAETQPAAILARGAADYILTGEGELTLPQLVRCLLGHGPKPPPTALAALPGLAWLNPDTGRLEQNGPPDPLADGAWPFPYRDEDLVRDKEKILYYEASRGCPFGCSYCLSERDRIVRVRPLEQVLDELDRLLAADVRLVKFVDRTFNLQPERARRIWRHLIARNRASGARTCFHFELGGDLLETDDLELLRQAPAGLFQFEIGVQSAHPDVLRAVNRPDHLDRLARQVSRLRQANNCHIHLDLIAGLPGETFERFTRSLDWVWALRPHQLQLGFLKLLPGTSLWRQARVQGWRWLDVPPYEVLETDSIGFGELGRLKQAAELLERYLNVGGEPRAFVFAASHWPRPWLFLDDLARDGDRRGLFDRALGVEERLRQLWQFVHASHKLTDSALGQLLDLLRTDFQLMGQKSQPAWLGFWEQKKDEPARAQLRQLRLTVRQAGWPVAANRLRFDRIRLDWGALELDGEVRAGDYLMVYGREEGRPVLLAHGPFAAGLPAYPAK